MVSEQDKELNEILNKQPWRINRHCVLCGRAYPDTILNCEAVMHGEEDYKCFDVETCEEFRRKKERKGKK